MILSEKIVMLRKKYGWSQEETGRTPGHFQTVRI